MGALMLFQKDYWAMDTADLETVARKFHIGAAVAGPNPYYDRKYAIDCLLARDSAMRTSLTILATLTSLMLTAINIGVFVASRLYSSN